MIKLRNLKGIVERQLRDKPELRDSDNKLVARIWYNHIENRSPIPVSAMSATDLLIGIGNNELPGWSSIVRVRRKIQQLNPDLRGKKYGKSSGFATSRFINWSILKSLIILLI